MAKVITSELIKALSGAMGGLVFRPMPDGTTWVSTAPHYRRRKFSKGQKDHQQRFRAASSYARGAARLQPIYAELAKGTMKTAYNIALSDWFNPPIIHQVQRRDGRIVVEASDNVIVTKVVITIMDDEGKVLDEGEGVRQKGDWWEYVPNIAGKRITAQAWDLAGHVTKSVM
jgi:hypothetical protein